MLQKIIITISALVVSLALTGQTGSIEGKVILDNQPMEFVNIYVTELKKGTTTDAGGKYVISKIPLGTYTVEVSSLGQESIKREVTLSQQSPIVQVDFELSDQAIAIDEVVVSGTKTFKRKTNSAVIVGVLNEVALDNVNACMLSDGLKFQPGLRVETDCQTCNYTQLRMNGLAGGYSQILINGRPIFSPLTGLYGMEQLPVNMIDRIEVIRGGGSSLYGSSAIGGTVNVITKIPKSNSYELNLSHETINGQAADNMLSGNATLVSPEGKSGISLFLNNRNRDWYDHNDDNYSEMPLLKNLAIGTNLFFLPSENQKLEISLSNLKEYRFGGEMIDDKPAYLAQQSEERDHDVWMGSADYQINLNDENTSIIVYAAWQNTDRKHYTGIIPDEGTAEYQNHIAAPPYGISDVSTYNGGLQVNHRLNNFLSGTNVITLGTEYTHDAVYDEIPSYRYLVDQTTKDWGAFVQSDWAISRELTLLSGVRVDDHNLVNGAVWSPRASLLYKPSVGLQLRANYGTGFRAPQAFDTDLHIAFAGGGISRVTLAPDLLPERSSSYSASVNYDKATEHYVAGFTLEGFYTQLDRAFILDPIGEDEFGERFEKKNGQGTEVRGVTLEVRANYDRKIQVEAGITYQSSEFEEAVEYIDELAGIREFIRTPRSYGFATMSYTPDDRLSVNLNYIYTGSMKVPHFAGAPNQTVDEIIDSPQFHELSGKVSYNIALPKMNTDLEIYTGIRNLFNSYQSSFDIGKNRDSNFVYGPSQPRTFYLGIKLKG